VRTLVNEGHIRTTSVAYMTEKTKKDGKDTVTRELLNGAFVAVPSNREALVLASKSTKAGARNSATDMEHIQAIHDHAVALGADTGGKAAPKPRVALKYVAGSLEATQARVSDALNDAYGENAYVWLRATVPSGEGGTCVFEIDSADGSDSDCWQQSYTDDGSVVTLTGDRRPVDLVETIRPDPDEDDSTATDAASAAAPAKAAAPGETPTADDDEIQTRARALAMSASIYAGPDPAEQE
jgi:hypothetical protein